MPVPRMFTGKKRWSFQQVEHLNLCYKILNLDYYLIPNVSKRDQILTHKTYDNKLFMKQKKKNMGKASPQ